MSVCYGRDCGACYPTKYAAILSNNSINVAFLVTCRGVIRTAERSDESSLKYPRSSLCPNGSEKIAFYCSGASPVSFSYSNILHAACISLYLVSSVEELIKG